MEDTALRDYAAATFAATTGCETPEELRQALQNARLHAGPIPDNDPGQDWRVGLLRALSTSEHEEAGWVVCDKMAIAMALLDDVQVHERVDALEMAVRALLDQADALGADTAGHPARDLLRGPTTPRPSGPHATHEPYSTAGPPPQCCLSCRSQWETRARPAGVPLWTITGQRMTLCPDCGNKRCPKATDHELACTASNATGQPGSTWERN